MKEIQCLGQTTVPSVTFSVLPPTMPPTIRKFYTAVYVEGHDVTEERIHANLHFCV